VVVNYKRVVTTILIAACAIFYWDSSLKHS
jgi:hypothetical protein